jgi:uncharacterized membrane protein|tara:strand:+ start:170 stop:514 length:345 start_codon:yes stop_codon:yes gene_type:complete
MEDYRLILTIGGVIASFATAWGVAKNQLKAIISDVSKIEVSTKTESDRIDSLLTRITVLENKITVVTGILQPEKLSQTTKESAEFQARTDERQERLFHIVRSVEKRLERLENNR